MYLANVLDKFKRIGRNSEEPVTCATQRLESVPEDESDRDSKVLVGWSISTVTSWMPSKKAPVTRR